MFISNASHNVLLCCLYIIIVSSLHYIPSHSIVLVKNRDHAARGLRTYFESRRADSHAMYYRDSLLGSKNQGVDESLDIVLAARFEDVVKHHQRILQDDQISVCCLFSGNVSSKEATEFFSCVKSKIVTACKIQEQDSSEPIIDSGNIERQLQQGQEVQLHFSSQNTEEENGAVLCTYQSSIPSFKGEKLSHSLGLESSSAIRLLCHILREPLFDSLRTKQQLGYIVRSYYEIGISSQSSAHGQVPLTTPVDFISINVLSQKMAPPQIVDRIDEFLMNFRNQLKEMPDSEIRDHADALATNLMKPIQKLQSEASIQNSRIQRYGPEVFFRAKHRDFAAKANLEATSSDKVEIPWDTTKSLASTIRVLTREDLLKTWDRMTHPSSRSRVVSCVYGKKFPLKCNNSSGASILTSHAPSGVSSSLFSSVIPIHRRGDTIATTKIVNSFPDLLKFRTTLPNFSPVSTSTTKTSCSGGLYSLLRQRREVYMLGLGVMGATILGWAMVNRSSKPAGKNTARN